MLAVLCLVPLLGLRCPSLNPIDDPNGGDPNGGNNSNNGNNGNPNPTGNLFPALDQAGPIALTVQRNSGCGGQGNQFTLNATDGDDAAATLTWYVRIAPQHGAASFVGASTGGTAVVCYAPTPSQSQSDSFSIGVYDPKGEIDFVDFNVTVNNSGPSITPPASTTMTVNQNSSNCGAANRITLSATDPDGAGDELEWLVQTAPAHGVVTLPAGKFGGSVPFCYTPNSNQTNSDSFAVRVRDEEGLFDSITINVNVLNTPPNITTGGPPNLIVWKNSPCSSPFNVATVTADDPDADEALLNWTVDTQPAHGTASIVGATSGGSIQVCYAPGQDNTAAASFMMRVADATGGTATVAVNIEIRTPPQGGRYDGTTSQGLPITFLLVDGAEPKLTEYEIQINSCPSPACCPGVGSFGCHPPLVCDPMLLAPPGTFVAGVMPVSVTGSFDAVGNVAGGAHAQISTGGNPNCPANPIVTDVTWTATRTGP